MAPFTVSGLTSVINQLLPEPHAGLLVGLLFGTKAALSRDFYNALVATGVLHIIALSGQNITIMEDLIGMMLLPLVGKRWAAAITIGIIVWFVWFVGVSASVVRAAIMGSMSLIAILFGRQYWALLSWAITVGIMLIINIGWVADISFQLSALATLGIILFGSGKDLRPALVAHKNFDPDSSAGQKFVIAPSRGLYRISSMIRIFVKWSRFVWSIIRDDLRLTLAAQVFTIPITLFTFHRFSLISPWANIAIGWVIAPVTMLGWMTVLLGFFVLYAGQVVAWIDWILLEYIIRTIQLLSQIPLASFGW